MNVLLFGATGMLGQSVLAECLRDSGVERVVVVARQPTGITSPKLREIVQPDIADLRPHAPELRDCDACLFCLGVSAVGMSEDRYSAITYDLTLSVARQLADIAPGMTFIYVSGVGTDSSERGRTMWARVKGRTENALLALPFHAAYMFRPGYIHPEGGARSKTTWYRLLYAVTGPLLPLLERAFPNQIMTTTQHARAMLAVARRGYERKVLLPVDIIRMGSAG